MKKPSRIAVEVLLPPVVVAVFITIAYVANHSVASAIASLTWLFSASFVVAAIPSVVYMVGVESAFALGLDPKKKLALAVSASVGAVVGCVFALALRENELWRQAELGDYLYFGSIGSLTGVVVGFVVRALTIRTSKNA
jgi:hypothetical protein